MIPAKNNQQLLKILGVGFGIAVTIGGTIGTGILRKPGDIAAAVPHPGWIMALWLAVGLYAICGSMCAAELGVSVPRAGAWYVYARRAFGSYFGFLTGITSWMGTVSALGFGAFSFCEYLALLFPSTADIIPIMAIVQMVLIISLHLIGTNIGGKSQQFFTIIKAFGLLLFVAICLAYGNGLSTNYNPELLTSAANHGMMAGIIAALQGIFYTYDGWHTAAYFTEEQSNPERDLPRSMIWGTIAIVVIYFLVNFAILYVVPFQELQSSKLAAALAIEKIFGTQASFYVTMFLMISILGINNTQVMFAPRVIYSMAKDGIFFKQMSYVNKGGSPYWGLILTGSLTILLIMIGKDACGRLSDIATFFFVFSYGAGFASLIRLRQAEPNLPRPYKVPLYPFLPAVLLILSLFFLIGAVFKDFNNSFYALGFIVLSFPVYLAFFKKR